MTASSIPPDIPLLGANNPCSFFAVLEFAKTQGTKQGTIAALLSLEIFMKIHSNTKIIQYDNTKYCTCISVFRGIERQHPESRTDRTIPGKHLARYLLPFVSLSGQGTRKSSQESPSLIVRESPSQRLPSALAAKVQARTGETQGKAECLVG